VEVIEGILMADVKGIVEASEFEPLGLLHIIRSQI
jgi:hypothetical protein